MRTAAGVNEGVRGREGGPGPPGGEPMEPPRSRGERHPHHKRRQDRRHAEGERAPSDEVGGKRRTDEQAFGLQCLKRPHDKRQDIAGDHPEDHGDGDDRGDTRGQTERAEGGDDQARNDHGSQEVRVGHRLAERGDKGDDGNVPGHEQRLAVGQGQAIEASPGAAYSAKIHVPVWREESPRDCAAARGKETAATEKIVIGMEAAKGWPSRATFR